MKVWHITRTLYGGAGIYAQRLSEALRDAGIDSCVLSADSDGPLDTAQLTADSGAAPRFVTRVVRSMSHRLTSAPYHSLMCAERYRGEQMPAKGDIIHLHGLTGWMGIRGLNALIPEGSPFSGQLMTSGRLVVVVFCMPDVTATVVIVEDVQFYLQG